MRAAAPTPRPPPRRLDGVYLTGAPALWPARSVAPSPKRGERQPLGRHRRPADVVVKEVAGRAAFLKATQRFYASHVSLDVRTLIIDGDQACAPTHYRLRSPSGNEFNSDVAEIFHVTNGKVDSFAIYFDTAPFPKWRFRRPYMVSA